MYIHGVRITVTCPAPECEKGFSVEVPQPGDTNDIEKFDEGVESVQTRLGQHMWSVHRINSDHEPDVIPQVVDIKVKKKMEQPRGRSRSPTGPTVGNSMNARPPLPRSQASTAASLKPAVPRRANMFTLEAQINLGAMPSERLRELSVAVQRELQVRHA